MLRALSVPFKQPFSVWIFQCELQKYMKIFDQPKTSFRMHNHSCIRKYAIKPRVTSFSENDTMSFKVLEHLKTNSECTDASTLSINRHNSFNSTYATQQMLLVISHSPEVRTNDILKLFSLYEFSKHSIMQDLVSKKSLMMTVKRRVQENISSMTQGELKTFAMIVQKLQFQKIKYLMDIATDICQECKQRALKADLQEAVELFDILYTMYGNNIYKKKEYDIFMALFEKHIASAQPHHLVQILHYLGIGKKKKISKDFVDSLVRELDIHLQDLSFEDAGIAIAGVFKSNVKLDASSSFIQKTVHHLRSKVEKCLPLNDLESYCLVAMIKIIRAARVTDQRLLSSMNAFIMKTDTDALSPQFIAHTLALYANSCIYHPDIFSKFENGMIQHLKAPLQTVRIRDLARVLWCFSHVSHNCSSDFFKIVDESLMEFVHCGETNVYPHFLSDSLFSMAILEHYPQELLKEAFKPNGFQQLQGYQKSKQMSRLLMLNECLKVEVPELTVEVPNISRRNVPTRTLTDEIHHRPALATLMEGAMYINQEVHLPVLKLKFIIPYINYASLVFDSSELSGHDCIKQSDSMCKQNYILRQLQALKEKFNGQLVALELMDSHSTLSGTSQPIGIMKMKMRLMNKCDWDIRRIHVKDLESCHNDIQGVAALILEKLTKVSS
ncbi:uncharacterized protein [Panulirus ornatus]|uniref:uncharacterized protein n=1 Tax=Panulirus ornatus TaxID=150431 RepID=UPI003A848BC1